MTKVATYPNKPGSVIKEELFAEHGYCRTEVNLLNLNKSDEVGLLVTIAANGDATIVEDAAAVAALTAGTDTVGILIDTSVYEDPAVTTTDADRADTAVFYRGPAVVAGRNCVLGDGSEVRSIAAAAQDNLSAVFEAQGIKNSVALKTK